MFWFSGGQTCGTYHGGANRTAIIWKCVWLWGACGSVGCGNRFRTSSAFYYRTGYGGPWVPRLGDSGEGVPNLCGCRARENIPGAGCSECFDMTRAAPMGRTYLPEVFNMVMELALGRRAKQWRHEGWGIQLDMGTFQFGQFGAGVDPPPKHPKRMAVDATGGIEGVGLRWKPTSLEWLKGAGDLGDPTVSDIVLRASAFSHSEAYPCAGSCGSGSAHPSSSSDNGPSTKLVLSLHDSLKPLGVHIDDRGSTMAMIKYRQHCSNMVFARSRLLLRNRALAKASKLERWTRGTVSSAIVMPCSTFVGGKCAVYSKMGMAKTKACVSLRAQGNRRPSGPHGQVRKTDFGMVLPGREVANAREADPQDVGGSKGHGRRSGAGADPLPEPGTRAATQGNGGVSGHVQVSGLEPNIHTMEAQAWEVSTGPLGQRVGRFVWPRVAHCSAKKFGRYLVANGTPSGDCVPTGNVAFAFHRKFQTRNFGYRGPESCSLGPGGNGRTRYEHGSKQNGAKGTRGCSGKIFGGKPLAILVLLGQPPAGGLGSGIEPGSPARNNGGGANCGGFLHDGKMGHGAPGRAIIFGLGAPHNEFGRGRIGQCGHELETGCSLAGPFWRLEVHGTLPQALSLDRWGEKRCPLRGIRVGGENSQGRLTGHHYPALREGDFSDTECTVPEVDALALRCGRESLLHIRSGVLDDLKTSNVIAAEDLPITGGAFLNEIEQLTCIVDT